jgi:transposase
MPRPIPVPVRQVMFRLWQRGVGAPEIAASLGVPCSTVSRMLQRFRREGGAAIPPSYRSPADDFMPPENVQAAIALRREHPTWGAEFIRVQLHEANPQRQVPTARTLRRWFERADLAPAPAGRRPRAESERTTIPHDTWQMDAKEHIKLKKNKQASWLRITDECSAAVLHTTVFPPRNLVAGPPW